MTKKLTVKDLENGRVACSMVIDHKDVTFMFDIEGPWRSDDFVRIMKDRGEDIMKEIYWDRDRMTVDMKATALDDFEFEIHSFNFAMVCSRQANIFG